MAEELDDLTEDQESNEIEKIPGITDEDLMLEPEEMEDVLPGESDGNIEDVKKKEVIEEIEEEDQEYKTPLIKETENKIPVRINSTLTVYVKKESDIERIKIKYKKYFDEEDDLSKETYSESEDKIKEITINEISEDELRNDTSLQS